MLYNFVELNRNDRTALCVQLYEGLRKGIESGRLGPGEHLLSIRQASLELGLSRTTVENAYQRLTLEGYAEARPQSGYRVRAVIPRRRKANVLQAEEPDYDFTTHGTDPDEADMENWKKLLRRVLTDVKAVSTYGDPQGEPELREALSSYSFRARGVSADPSMIFIGAGTGPLLQLLCPLLDRNMPVIMEEPGFPLLDRIFSDYGFSIRMVPSEGSYPEEGMCMLASLPSMRKKRPADESAQDRKELLSWLEGGPERYLLEDDYNGELRDRTRPLSSCQSLSPGKTIYIGSFSKLLLPSVRAAYMVLPEELAGKARRRLITFNQTAGKTEQLALAEYISSGLLEKHLRRLRRLYSKKSWTMENALSGVFGRRCSYELLETSLAFSVSFDTSLSADLMVSLAGKAGIAVRKAPGTGDGKPRLLIGFSSVREDGIEEGMKALSKAWNM